MSHLDRAGERSGQSQSSDPAHWIEGAVIAAGAIGAGLLLKNMMAGREIGSALAAGAEPAEGSDAVTSLTGTAKEFVSLGGTMTREELGRTLEAQGLPLPEIKEVPIAAASADPSFLYRWNGGADGLFNDVTSARQSAGYVARPEYSVGDTQWGPLPSSETLVRAIKGGKGAASIDWTAEAALPRGVGSEEDALDQQIAEQMHPQGSVEISRVPPDTVMPGGADAENLSPRSPEYSHEFAHQDTLPPGGQTVLSTGSESLSGPGAAGVQDFPHPELHMVNWNLPNQ